MVGEGPLSTSLQHDPAEKTWMPTFVGMTRRKKDSGMQYTKLGHTGLDVSRLCLGCMSYGGGNSGFHQWSLGEEESRPFIKKALEAGINFFDTVNRYSLGRS